MWGYQTQALGFDVIVKPKVLGSSMVDDEQTLLDPICLLEDSFLLKSEFFGK